MDNLVKYILYLFLAGLIICGVVWVFNNADFSTSDERARIFCENNSMVLQRLEWEDGFRSKGECVGILDGGIYEVRNIVYIEGIKDWAFDIRDTEEGGKK